MTDPAAVAPQPKVLVVEDEPRILRLVSEILRASGYRTLGASSGDAALETVALESPDLVLLDVLLGRGPDGIEVLRRLRQFSDVGVIMLTAKATDGDILSGFEAGADDYLTKPFNAKELVARVQAVLRRTLRPDETIDAVFRCGRLEVNFARRAVTVDGAPVSLTRTEFALLRQLALQADRVVSSVDLLAEVWGPEYRDDIDYLRAYIRHLRRKLEPDPAAPVYLVTSPGVGYMLTCPPS